MLESLKIFPKEISLELDYLNKYEETHKDILIVVKDQLQLFQNCINSIQSCTKNYTLYVWNNNSNIETKNFIDSIPNVITIHNDKNDGFIKPNNELVKLGNSPYVILLNSDTVVSDGWDKALISWLQNNPNDAMTGYQGAILNENMEGTEINYGYDVDYIEGWCMCFHRDLYNKIGLFDQNNLKFAYGEDSDLCLRVKESGKNCYALHLGLVFHVGHATIQSVDSTQIESNFSANHAYLRNRWNRFLSGRTFTSQNANSTLQNGGFQL